MTSTKPNRRKVAWVVLGVVVLACAFAAPKAWERIQFRAVETVSWPDGSLRFEYRWRRWGDKGASLVGWNPDGNKWEVGGGGSPAILTINTPRDDGIYETFVFPGNQGEPDLLTSEKPTDQQIQSLVEKRKATFGPVVPQEEPRQ